MHDKPRLPIEKSVVAPVYPIKKIVLQTRFHEAHSTRKSASFSPGFLLSLTISARHCYNEPSHGGVHYGRLPAQRGCFLANYLLIESRDPFEYGDARYMYDMAADLARKGNSVTLFLIQNGVLVTRPGVRNNPLNRLFQQSQPVRVLADEFSLRERAIAPTPLVGGVEVSDVDFLVDLLAKEDTKALWH